MAIDRGKITQEIALRGQLAVMQLEIQWLKHWMDGKATHTVTQSKTIIDHIDRISTATDQMRGTVVRRYKWQPEIGGDDADALAKACAALYGHIVGNTPLTDADLDRARQVLTSIGVSVPAIEDLVTANEPSDSLE